MLAQGGVKWPVDPETVAASVRLEFYRSKGAYYLHRLHAVLLVARGLSTRRVAELLGDSPRSVAGWVQRYLEEGASGLMAQSPGGRKPRLTTDQLNEARCAVTGGDGGHWSGKKLSDWILERYGVRLQVRQCQRLLTRFGPSGDSVQCFVTQGPKSDSGSGRASLPAPGIAAGKE